MQQLKSKHPNKKEKLETTGVSKSIRIQTTKAQLKQHVNIAPFLYLYTRINWVHRKDGSFLSLGLKEIIEILSQKEKEI